MAPRRLPNDDGSIKRSDRSVNDVVRSWILWGATWLRFVDN